MADDDQFEGREKRYGAEIGPILGSMGMNIAKADAEMKRTNYGIIQGLLKETENFELKQSVDLGNGTPPVTRTISVPPIAIYDMKVIGFESVTFKSHMEVKAHQEESSHKGGGFKASGSVGFGIGPIKAGSIKLSGSMSVSNDRKRSSDYTSTMDVEAIWSRQEASEGLMKIVDASVTDVTRSMEADEGRVQRQLSDAKDAADQKADGDGAPADPAPEDGGSKESKDDEK